MKRLLFLPFLIIAVQALAFPPAPPLSKNPTFGTVTADAFVSSEVTSQTGVEYPVWEAMDSNGDVVSSMTVECSDLTDGSQDCSAKLYTMVEGVLTLDSTFDGVP